MPRSWVNLEGSGIGIIYFTQLVVKSTFVLVVINLFVKKSSPNPTSAIVTACEAFAQKVKASNPDKSLPDPSPSILKMAPA